MVASEAVPGLSVEVLVESHPLKEYPFSEKVKHPRTIRYIEAKSGEQFELKLVVSSEYPYQDDALDVGIYIDGRMAYRPVILSESFSKEGSPYTRLIFGRTDQVGESFSLQRFTFSNLLFEADGVRSAKLDTKQTVEHIGIIELQFFRCKASIDAVSYKRSKPLGEIGKVFEKDLKGEAVSLGTSYAPPEETEPITVYDTIRLNPDRPLAVIKFYYRSLKDLQILGIIPRPSSLEEKPIDQLTPDELKQLLHRERENVSRLQKDVKALIKRKRSSDAPKSVENSDDLSIVEERPSKRQKPEPGAEIVDLTEL